MASNYYTAKHKDCIHCPHFNEANKHFGERLHHFGETILFMGKPMEYWVKLQQMAERMNMADTIDEIIKLQQEVKSLKAQMARAKDALTPRSDPKEKKRGWYF